MDRSMQIGSGDCGGRELVPLIPQVLDALGRASYRRLQATPGRTRGRDAHCIVAAALEARPMRRDRRPRVAIVVETLAIREALAQALAAYGLNVVDRSSDPDVLLVDVGAAALISVVREAAASSVTPLLAIGVRNADRDVLACIEAGAVGYVLQDASLDELADAVNRAVRDEPLASPHVIATLMRRVAALSETGRRETIGSLTSRELEVAELIEQGLSNKE